MWDVYTHGEKLKLTKGMVGRLEALRKSKHTSNPKHVTMRIATRNEMPIWQSNFF